MSGWLLSWSGLDERWTRAAAYVCLGSERGKSTEQRPRNRSGSSEGEAGPQAERSSDHANAGEGEGSADAPWATVSPFLKESCTDSESFGTRGSGAPLEPIILVAGRGCGGRSDTPLLELMTVQGTKEETEMTFLGRESKPHNRVGGHLVGKP